MAILAISTASDDMNEWGYGWCPSCKAWRKIRLVYLDENQNPVPLRASGRGQAAFAQIKCVYRGHEIAHLAYEKPVNP